MLDRFALPVLFVLCAGCATNRNSGLVGDGAITGSSADLTPRVVSAGVLPRGELVVSIELPRSGFVSAFSILNGSVALLSSNVGDEMSRTEMTAGSHRLALRQVPLSLRGNAVRAAELLSRSRDAQNDVAQRTAGTFALIVVTEKPVSWADVQSSLSTVDFRGASSDVIPRVARAIGDESDGRWGAASARATDM